MIKPQQRSARGAATIETAIVLSGTILILFWAFEFSILGLMQLQTDAAAFIGARSVASSVGNQQSFITGNVIPDFFPMTANSSPQASQTQLGSVIQPNPPPVSAQLQEVTLSGNLKFSIPLGIGVSGGGTGIPITSKFDVPYTANYTQGVVDYASLPPNPLPILNNFTDPIDPDGLAWCRYGNRCDVFQNTPGCPPNKGNNWSNPPTCSGVPYTFGLSWHVLAYGDQSYRTNPVLPGATPRYLQLMCHEFILYSLIHYLWDKNTGLFRSTPNGAALGMDQLLVGGWQCNAPTWDPGNCSGYYKAMQPPYNHGVPSLPDNSSPMPPPPPNKFISNGCDTADNCVLEPQEGTYWDWRMPFSPEYWVYKWDYTYLSDQHQVGDWTATTAQNGGVPLKPPPPNPVAGVDGLTGDPDHCP